MINSQFQNLCREVSVVLQETDVDAFSRSGEIQIAGIDMSIHFDEEMHGDRIVCYLDLGPIEDRYAGEVMQKLLTLNLIGGSKREGVYAIDPLSGNALLIAHLADPDRFDGQSLTGALQTFAARALATQNVIN